MAVKQEIIDLLKKSNQDLARLVKQYVDAGDANLAAQLAEKQTAIDGIVARLDFLDKVDSEDGVDTLIERVNTLAEVVSGGEGTNIIDRLNQIDQTIAGVNNTIDALASRVTALESAVQTINSTLDTKLNTAVFVDIFQNNMCELQEGSSSVFGVTLSECDTSNDNAL